MRIRNYETLTNHGNIKGRRMLADIMEAGLSAGNPYNNTLKLMSIKGNKLIFDNSKMEAPGDPRRGPAVYDLDKIERIFVFAVGKGILYMVKAVEEVLGDRLTGGYAIGKHGDEIITGDKIKVTLGGHPVPDEHGVRGCEEMLEMIASLSLTENDLALTVMGNGCSSLANLPDKSISVQDIKDYTQLCLIDSGISTNEFSYLRNQVDRFRGGRILQAIRPAQIVNLMGIGPVMAGSIGKFPTDYECFTKGNYWLPNMADCTTTAEAIEIAKKWRVWDRLPQSIRDKLLSNPPQSATLGWEEYEGYNARLFCVMPSSMSALGAAMDKAKEFGFETRILTRATLCEAAPVGRYVAQVAKNCAREGEPFKPPIALFGTGELIVTVGGESGIGGTNQEYCVSAAIVLAGDKQVVMSAIDTDGTDGPGGNFDQEAWDQGIRCLTGGIVDGYTAAEAKEKGVDLFGAMKTHGTSKALWDVGSGIAAVQNISVADLHCTLILAKEEDDDSAKGTNPHEG